jgi:UDP-N-acetyl-L-fucosamine synthase
MAKIKVLTVVGTRPELIRLSRLIPLLDKFTDHVLVHTGQNYDANLSDIFFEDLELRPPDYFLGIRGDSLGGVLGNLFPAIEEVLVKESPDAVALLGDTNSSLSAIVAERMGIPVYHMEAGNRSFDPNVPEELNRKVVDHASSFNLPYSERARTNLLAEGLHPRRIYLTGSPMLEVFESHSDKIRASNVRERLGLTQGGYIVASFHREENVDNPEYLQAIIESLAFASRKFSAPILVSLHPRTKSRLASAELTLPNEFVVHEPLNFSDYAKLQIDSKFVASDSGSISEESAIFGFPAITLRQSMERQEAIETNSILMSGYDSDLLSLCADFLERREHSPAAPVEYMARNFSERVLGIILSTVRLAGSWGVTKTI